jgi:hypothetical protein
MLTTIFYCSHCTHCDSDAVCGLPGQALQAEDEVAGGRVCAELGCDSRAEKADESGARRLHIPQVTVLRDVPGGTDTQTLKERRSCGVAGWRGKNARASQQGKKKEAG